MVDQTGNITEIEVLLAFTKLGYTVSLPYGGKEKYDLAVDIGGKILRIQCKTSASYRDGNAFTIDLRHKKYANSKRSYISYSKDDIDYFATSYQGKCYLLSVDECYLRKVLRLKKTVIEDRADINWAEDYELETIVKSIVEAKKDER